MCEMTRVRRFGALAHVAEISSLLRGITSRGDTGEEWGFGLGVLTSQGLGMRVVGT